jgi:hypothetical protein
MSTFTVTKATASSPTPHTERVQVNPPIPSIKGVQHR